MPTIGVNYLSADRPLWFTLADCVASKLLDWQGPESRARHPVLGETAATEPPSGRDRRQPEFRVDPYKDDFYKRVIELRRRVKADLKDAKTP